jgi:DNA replication protein DnaC
VIGSNGSGKTRLSVGIANELAIRHRLSTYTTFSKLCGLLQDDDEATQRNNFSLWTWTESDFLLCDDINPGQPKEANQTSVKDVRTYLELSQSVRNYEVLKNTSVAWVIGALAESDTVDAWVAFIEMIGIDKTQIKVIDLNAAIN